MEFNEFFPFLRKVDRRCHDQNGNGRGMRSIFSLLKKMPAVLFPANEQVQNNQIWMKRCNRCSVFVGSGRNNYMVSFCFKQKAVKVLNRGIVLYDDDTQCHKFSPVQEISVS